MPLIRALLLCCLFATLTAGAQPRQVLNFNLDWRLHVGDPEGAAAPDFDDAGWQAVSLPRAWNEDDAFARDIVDHRTGIAWYRKHFRLPAAALQGKVLLEFEGARQAAEVFVNGRRVGLHENGVNAFGFDIGAHLQAGDNLVAVRTDNRWDYREQATNQRYQWADRNFNANYGGLPKNLRLHLAGKLYQTLPLYASLGSSGVYVYAREHDIAAGRASVWAESELRNEHATPRRVRVEMLLRELDGRLKARFLSAPQTVAAGASAVLKAGGAVQGLQFWSWGHGYLYEVETRLLVDGEVVDAVTTRTGFRKTAFGDGLVRLNDRVLQLKGYAQRTSNEWPAIGLSVPPWLSDHSNGLMVEGNANLVRWMHTAPWKQDVESLDRQGLLQAMPAGDSEADVSGRRWEQRVEAMRDAIIYFRNHPSIVFYEAGNRGVSAEHMREMRALRDRWDPHGGRAAGSREMLSQALQAEAEYGGEMLYINKSARNPVWAMEYSRDEGARKFWDEGSPPFHRDGDGPLHKGQDASSYNRNQDSHAIENLRRWVDYWRARPGTGSRVSSGGVNILFSDSNTHHRGAENYRRSGEVDAMRIPKDGFFAHQVLWDGWVDIERPRVHLLGHWNELPGGTRTVNAIASSARVALELNGQRIAEQGPSEPFLFRFDKLAWAPGELRAIALDENGKAVAEARQQSSGSAVALRLSAQTAPAGWRADGADLALVQVEVVDAQGRRNPIALDTVQFELDGAAEWRGGIAQGPGNHVLARSLPVEGGVNRVLLRSLRDAGTVRLRARAEGLAPAELQLSTLPAPPLDQLPGADLAPRLSRGPTPATPSFRVSRIALAVASVSADSQQDEAALSFDDDETTRWASEPGRGRIRYRLAEAATLSEIVLKLSGWRERGYPLRVRVDGEPVFTGLTPKSLGYVSLPLRPQRGQEISIELDGVADESQAIALSEVANQKITDTGASRTPKGVLSIVEIEFYRLP